MFSRHIILATTVVVLFLGFKYVESRYTARDEEQDTVDPVALMRQWIRDSILVFMCSFATLYVSDVFERPLATFFSMITGQSLVFPTSGTSPKVFLGPPGF